MNEREYLQQLSRFTPDQIAAEVLHADEHQARVLRIYLGSDQFDRIQKIASLGLARGEAPALALIRLSLEHGLDVAFLSASMGHEVTGRIGPIACEVPPLPGRSATPS